MSDEALSVSELADRIQRALDDASDGEIWVQGELQGLTRRPNGHVWFDLVEPGPPGGPPIAKVQVVLFERNRRAVNALLKRHGGVRITDGMAIRVRGSLDFYGPQGRVQVVMTGVDPTYTLGRLAEHRERILHLLSSEGLLDRNGRIPVPLVPLRIGLVTAADSAAAADFVHELSRSGHAFAVVHHDARMQGRDAERSIIAALLALEQRQLDTIALVRGGGARTELACFDSEQLARTIAGLATPVYTGIGHETDRSVADEVAHTAFKTPTACAAAIVTPVDLFLDGLSTRAGLIADGTRRALDQQAHRVQMTAAAAARNAQRTLDRHRWQLTQRHALLASRPLRVLDAHGRALGLVTEEMGRRATRSLHRTTEGLDHRAARVQDLDPQRVLARGWSITTTADGRVARAADLRPGDELRTTLADGLVTGTVLTSVPVPPSPDPPRSTHEPT